MRWAGMTKRERLAHDHAWHSVFAWLPKKMDDGPWVWLERYEQIKMAGNISGECWAWRSKGSTWQPHPSLLGDGPPQGSKTSGKSR